MYIYMGKLNLKLGCLVYNCVQQNIKLPRYLLQMNYSFPRFLQ